MRWWQRVWRRKQMEAQLDQELNFHLEQHVRDLISQGLDPGEARRMALIALGGSEQVKEECRDARGTRWLEDLWQDFRYAARSLWKRPGFAAVVLLTLALGTGATTVMFTVVNGVLLKPLPYPEPDRLVVLNEETAKASSPLWGNRWAFAYPNFLDCQRASRTLAVAAWRYNGGLVSEHGDAEYVDGFQVSSNLFSVLGVSLSQGRAFLPDEDQRSAAPVIIVSYSLWQRMFGGRPGLVGKALSLDGKPYTIVGITPAGFKLNLDDADIFTLLGQDPSPNMEKRDRHPGIAVLARLRPAAKLAEAQTELALIGRQLEEEYPQSNKDRTFVVEPMHADVGDVRSTLWLLLGAVSLVLLIACANVASLLLARAVSRERELALRVALGASRARLVRQYLTESMVLGFGGGILGVWLAAVGIRPFVGLWPGTLPRAAEVGLDWRVLGFTMVISLLTGVLFGLAPALRAPARELEYALRAGSRSVAGSSRRLHGSFVISEIALAVVLLIAAAMLGRTLIKLSALDPGFDYRNVLVARMALSPDVLKDPARIRAAWQDVLERARRVPGVERVATVDTVPMREGNNQLGYWNSPAIPPPDQQPLALSSSASPDYLKVMGIPLLKGRFFDDHDRLGSEHVVVIDDVLAERAFGNQEPIGKYLWLPDTSSPFSIGPTGPDAARIVGVVRHVRYWGLASDDQARVRAQFYYPFAQVPDGLMRRWSELMSITVRASVPPANVLGALRGELRGATGGVGGDQALYEVRTMEQLVSDSIARQRFLLLLFGVFASLALMLACVGIYGVLAYLTGQRVPEIGVRMALGAGTRTVMWLVLRQSLTMIAAGTILGTTGAWAAGRLMAHLVEGMQPPDPVTFAITIPILVVAALLASFIPAYRASRIDPTSALRQE